MIAGRVRTLGVVVGLTGFVMIVLAGVPMPTPSGDGAGSNLGLGSCNSDQLAGVVFRDINSSASQDGFEPGEPGITVTAFDSSNVSAATTTTASDGTFLLTVTPGQYRVEVTGLASHLRPGPQSANTQTTAIFTSAGDCSLNVAVTNPAQYCDSNPTVVTPRYAAGNPLLPGRSANAKVLISYAYNQEGKSSDPGYSAPVMLAKNFQVGAVWGVAVQRSTKKIFSSAVMKRHAGLGPSSIGGLYVTDYSTPGSPLTSLFVDLPSIGIDTGVDPRNGTNQGLPVDPNNPSVDAPAFTQVGKIGVGDIEISEDESTLWLIGLATRTLYSIDIGTPAITPTSSDVTAFPIPDPGCSNGDYRPWALKIHDGAPYVGVTCTAETSQNPADLHAYVYKFDGSNFVPFANTTLSYSKGFTINDVLDPVPDDGMDFHPWARNMDDIYVNPDPGPRPFVFLAYPQPILSGIEFVSGGRMILGIMDRTGMQFGPYNYAMPPLETTFVNAPSGGDLIMFCPDGSGVLQPESNGSCGGVTTAGANTKGLGGGEYFFEENLDITHEELALGALAYLWGSNEILTTSYDSFEFEDGGQRTFDLTTAQLIRRYQIYTENRFSGTFGKSVGLGDVEYLCEPAPLEIGNRIFLDSDMDGIQGASEQGIAGVTVNLYDAGNMLVSTKVTDSAGEYYFREVDGLQKLGTYSVRLDNAADYQSGGPLDGLMATNADMSSDLHDSDCIDGGSGVEIMLATGVGGENDHTYDCGFKTIPICVPEPEICDQIDNDCDNEIDEGEVCATPTPTPTPTLTPTPTPTPTVTPTPTATPPCTDEDLSEAIAQIDGAAKALLAYGKQLQKVGVKANKGKTAVLKKLNKLVDELNVLHLSAWTSINTKVPNKNTTCNAGVSCISIETTSITGQISLELDQMLKKINSIIKTAKIQGNKKVPSLVKLSKKVVSEAKADIAAFPAAINKCNP